MKKVQIAMLVSVAAALSGCATTFEGKNAFFRDRELDYLHHPVHIRAPLVVPKDMTAPKFKPVLVLPKGKTSYPAEQNPDVLLPPGYHKTVAVPKAKVIAKPQDSHATDSGSSSMSSLFSWMNPHAKQEQKVQKLKDEIAEVQSQMQAVKSGKGKIQTTTTQSHLTSEIVFDKNNSGLLTIDAPMSIAWNRIQKSIGQTDYTITKQDKGSGLIYIKPSNKPKSKALMVYVYGAANTSKVSIFTLNGKLDKSTEAYSILQQIKANLNS